MPYYYSLRGDSDILDSMKRIHQTAYMMVWSQDVHGIMSMSETLERPLLRKFKSERSPLRKKSQTRRFASLPFEPSTLNQQQPYTGYELIPQVDK